MPFAILLLASALALPASAATFAQPVTGKLLVNRLIALAENGRAGDPAYVAAQLGVHLASHPATMAESTRFCFPGRARRDADYVRYTAGDPVKPADRLTVNYVVNHWHDCSGYLRMSRETTVSLGIGLPRTPDCITEEQLTRWRPDLHHDDVTDGGIGYSRVSAATRRSGTTLTFMSTVGDRCMESAHLQIEPNYGARMAAAHQKQAACMLPHQQAFCRRHPPFGWGAGDVQDAMDADAARQCGTFDSYVARTPLNATPLPEPELAGPHGPEDSTPCSVVDLQIATARRRRP